MLNFVEFLEEAGFDPYPYAGRSMYGKQCVAVTASSFGRFFADILLTVESIGSESLEDLASIFEGMKWDNMGYDFVFYFPQIKWDSNEAHGDESEDEDGVSLREVDDLEADEAYEDS